MKGLTARVVIVASMALLALSVAPAVAGYDGQVASHVGVSGVCPSPTSTNATVSATVVDNSGNPVVGLEVAFSANGVVLATAITDQNGRAVATLPLPPGDTTVVARAGAVDGRAIVICPEGGVGGVIGLPRTDTAPSGAPWWLALVACAAIVLTRFAVRTAR
jgi:hypothetical protein